MDAPGDISDEFDDEILKTSIEQADQAGEWRDEDGGFVDPKLETIKKQLAEREHETYAQRRMRELQKQAAARAAAAATTAGVTITERRVEAPGRADEPPMPPAADPSYVWSHRSSHPVLAHLQPIASGLWLFAPIGLVQALLTGRHSEMAARALIAAALTGVLWQKLDVDRFRAGIVGVAVYTLVFFVTASAWDAYGLIANSTGFVIAMIGSIVIGSLRESRKLLADRGR